MKYRMISSPEEFLQRAQGILGQDYGATETKPSTSTVNGFNLDNFDIFDNPEPEQPEPVKKKMPGLEQIATIAYERLTKEVVRMLASSQNRFESAKDYIRKFTEKIYFTQDQVNRITSMFLSYTKEKVSQAKRLNEQLEDFYSSNKKERLERENAAYSHIMSKLREGDIETNNPTETVGDLASRFYLENGFELKQYEIRRIAKNVERGTLYNAGRIVSLEPQMDEFRSLNKPEERSDRIKKAYDHVMEYMRENKELSTINPENTMRNLATTVYKLNGFPSYRNEILAVVRSAMKRAFFDPEKSKLFSLEDRLAFG